MIPDRRCWCCVDDLPPPEGHEILEVKCIDVFGDLEIIQILFSLIAVSESILEEFVSISTLNFRKRQSEGKRNFKPDPVCSVRDYAQDTKFLWNNFTYISHSDHANRCIVVRLSLRCSCLLQFTVKQTTLDFFLSIKRTKWRVINFIKTKQKCSRFYV